jgi:2-oxoglutarate dehydrogenase E1 component
LSQPLDDLSLTFVETLYADYLRDAESVEPEWREYFRTLHGDEGRNGAPVRLPRFAPSSIFNPPGRTDGEEVGRACEQMAILQDRVDQLVRSYRVRGHVIADLDPLGVDKPLHPELDYRYYGLTEDDLDRRFSCLTMNRGDQFLTLREILDQLKKTYCGYIGVQYMHIDDVEVKRWLQSRMEDYRARVEMSREEQIRILTRLTDAEIFEQFVQKKFVGAKRFSLEGAETLIPLLDLALEAAGRQGVREVIIGMAHRGRLNVLANVMQKSPALIFREFEDKDPELHFGGGDVKYHLGYASTWTTSEGKRIHLELCFNPSHLEFVWPVVEGRVRSRQDRLAREARDRGGEPYPSDPSVTQAATQPPTLVDRRLGEQPSGAEKEARNRVMALVIHGDASFAGEGIVQESLNLSELQGYGTGGTVHVIVNNQVGFTTPPHHARSSQYPTDVARMLQIPIFHVNGEDPESVAHVIKMAMDFRERFKKDIVIDMYCYRRHGHNEGDEPAFTQPMMYRVIQEHPSVRESYVQNLVRLQKVSREEAERIAVERRAWLDGELSRARHPKYDYRVHFERGVWTGYRGGADREVPDVPTFVAPDRLRELLLATTSVPPDFHPHPKLARLLEQRREMADGKRPLDWGGGEALAFATLISEGTRLRVSGQDSRRGTFSHRHAVWHDRESGRVYHPYKLLWRHAKLDAGQGSVDFWDSPLSEAGVLGFEWGYALDMPEALVVWEAQFGDFANVAQVIIDQFIVSSEAKWGLLNGLVLLLPHGFEGQGPEHSSARLERFLALTAQDNIQVCNLTTPAQLFHCLRRQVLRPYRKPLIVMSPKSLLRHPAATSPLDDFAEGRFHRVLGDASISDPEAVERILMCSGKIYYELAAAREERGLRDKVAILRLEQLYPVSEEAVNRALAGYPRKVPVTWVQEEPANMGALSFMKERYGEKMFAPHPFVAIARPESASPATGSGHSHRVEQEWLIAQAFDLS